MNGKSIFNALAFLFFAAFLILLLSGCVNNGGGCKDFYGRDISCPGQETTVEKVVDSASQAVDNLNQDISSAAENLAQESGKSNDTLFDNKCVSFFGECK